MVLLEQAEEECLGDGWGPRVGGTGARFSVTLRKNAGIGGTGGGGDATDGEGGGERHRDGLRLGTRRVRALDGDSFKFDAETDLRGIRPLRSLGCSFGESVLAFGLL